MQSSNILLSIALVTRNGPERLERCLRSVRSQNVQPFEIVVSDDSSPEFAEKTRAVAEQYACRYSEGPRKGLYSNRNAAALACRGTHVRTMDDDHTFPAGHFALCLNAIHADPDAIWTTGEIGFVDDKFHDAGKTANQLHPSGVGFPPSDPDDNWSLADGSTIYPASVFLSGFHMIEEWGYGSSYLEFGAFLYHHGYRSRCVPGAAVEHHAGIGTIERDRIYSREQASSLLFASLAYNLRFKPNLLKAIRYAGSIIVHSGFDPGLIANIPRIISSVYSRWK